MAAIQAWSERLNLSGSLQIADATLDNTVIGGTTPAVGSISKLSITPATTEAVNTFGQQRVGSVGVQWYPGDGLYFKYNATGSAGDRFVMTADGRLYGLALHNNAGAVTGATNQYIASGTYTPALTNVTNVAASTMRQCQWLRVGNVVHVTGYIDIDVTTGANTDTSFNLTLPIASALANSYELAGVASCGPDVPRIVAEPTSDQASFNYKSNDATNQPLTFAFSYLVL